MLHVKKTKDVLLFEYSITNIFNVVLFSISYRFNIIDNVGQSFDILMSSFVPRKTQFIAIHIPCIRLMWMLGSSMFSPLCCAFPLFCCHEWYFPFLFGICDIFILSFCLWTFPLSFCGLFPSLLLIRIVQVISLLVHLIWIFPFSLDVSLSF